MAWFGRRRREGERELPEGDELAEQPGGTGDAADGAGPEGERGPWDVADVSGRGRRVDLGAIWVPGRDGMQMRMEVERTSRIVTAAAVSLGDSAMQLQVFAAPRRSGIWDEIRTEIAEGVTKQGGTVDDLPGPFGRELLARVPVRTQEGRTGHRPARFIGHDGPRWFLRGVLTGRAAVEPEQAADLEALFADVVVIRGSEPRTPRELLPLTMPGTRSREPVTEQTFDPLRRGPEITEIR